MSQLEENAWFDGVRDTQRIPIASADAVAQQSSARIARAGGGEPRGLERYRILRELGRGGYGAVYLAVDTRSDALVALKVPTERPEPELHARFVREAYSLIAVQSEHVVRVLDVGTCARRPYYAMDFVPGGSLHDHVTSRGPLVEPEARALLAGLLHALAAVHQHRLVHRDVKPPNIILRMGAVAAPVLVDFGLTRLDQDLGLTDPDMLLGTPEFLAPETIREGPYDRRSDLYAAAITVRYALEGATPFVGLRDLKLLDAIARGPAPAPPGTASAPFRGLLDALCAADPELRPQTAEVALERLAELDRAG